MATATKEKGTESVKDSAAHGAAHTLDAAAAKIEPRRKRKYSRGLGAVQHIERGVAQGLETLSESIAKVFSEYSTRSDKSARKKKDGALRDGIENITVALSKGLRVAGKAPYKFVKGVNRGPGSKQFRDAIRLLTPPPLR
jgi:hypothetical protein